MQLDNAEWPGSCRATERARWSRCSQARFSARRTWRCPCRRRCTAWPGPSWRCASAFRSSSVVSTRAPEAPIGWPMAMAPPLTLTLAGSQPMSLLTAQACAAKASLASTRSRSSTFQPAFLQRRARRRDRAGAHDRGIDAGLRPGHDARQRRHAALGGLARLISTTAAAPSLMPEALAAVTVPSLSKAGRSLAIAFQRGAVPSDIRRYPPRRRPCAS